MIRTALHFSVTESVQGMGMERLHVGCSVFLHLFAVLCLLKAFTQVQKVKFLLVELNLCLITET